MKLTNSERFLILGEKPKMYNREIIDSLVEFVSARDGIADKAVLTTQVQREFNLVKDRSVYYGDWFAIRFCKAATSSFSNTVLSLSALHRYDLISMKVLMLLTHRIF